MRSSYYETFLLHPPWTTLKVKGFIKCSQWCTHATHHVRSALMMDHFPWNSTSIQCKSTKFSPKVTWMYWVCRAAKSQREVGTNVVTHGVGVQMAEWKWTNHDHHRRLVAVPSRVNRLAVKLMQRKLKFHHLNFSIKHLQPKLSYRFSFTRTSLGLTKCFF